MVEASKINLHFSDNSLENKTACRACIQSLTCGTSIDVPIATSFICVERISVDKLSSKATKTYTISYYICCPARTPKKL